MTSIRYNVVLVPAPELAQKAITISRQLRSYGVLYTLKNGTCYPHLSLYMTLLKPDDLGKAKQLLAAFAAQASPFDLPATRYHQAERYIDVEYTRTRALSRLQTQIVEAINPIRDGMRQKDKARLPTIADPVRENFEKYGYGDVGEQFRPHLSLTRFENEQVVETSSLPSVKEFDGQFTRLGLYELGPSGTCIREIAEFTL